MIKMVLLGIGTFVSTCFLYLCSQTRSPLSDIFTTERISILKDRPKNIERDIIIDMSLLITKGGILTLTQALIADIAKKRPNWRLLILIGKGYRHFYTLPTAPNVKLIEINNSTFPFALIKRSIIPAALGGVYDKLVQLVYYDLIFCDKYCDLVWDPTGDESACNLVNTPRISTVHDVACFDVDPEFFATDGHMRSAQVCITNAIRFSKKIITVSKFSQKRICDKFNVSADFVHEIPIKLGTRVLADNDSVKRTEVMKKYKLEPQKYFIFCSAWWRNKNHGMLMKAFKEFTKKNPEIKLILVGMHPKLFQGKPVESYQNERLIIAGFISNDELAILLKNALAFIHPSVYEGFGMPIIEAMANGIPVACSNAASLPEVAGNAALLFDPFNINSIVEAMHKLADNPQLRTELIQKGYVQAKKYENRDEMVDEYIRVMEEVMEKKSI